MNKRTNSPILSKLSLRKPHFLQLPKRYPTPRIFFCKVRWVNVVSSHVSQLTALEPEIGAWALQKPLPPSHPTPPRAPSAPLARHQLK